MDLVLNSNYGHMARYTAESVAKATLWGNKTIEPMSCKPDLHGGSQLLGTF